MGKGYYIHSCIKMKYKRSFHPTFVLGKDVSIGDDRVLLTTPDPKSYEWDALDEDMLARMTVRKYVSMSHERTLGLTRDSECRHYEEDEQKDGSLFGVNMPGVMTVEKLQESLELEAIPIRVKGNFCFFKVCIVNCENILHDYQLNRVVGSLGCRGDAHVYYRPRYSRGVHCLHWLRSCRTDYRRFHVRLRIGPHQARVCQALKQLWKGSGNQSSMESVVKIEKMKCTTKIRLCRLNPRLNVVQTAQDPRTLCIVRYWAVMVMNLHST